MPYTRLVWFALFLLAIPAAASAQAEPKSPVLSTISSLVLPGGGQMYSGETAKGFTLLAAAVSSYLIGASFPPHKCSYQTGVDPFGNPLGGTRNCPDSNRPRQIGIGVAAAFWLYGILDAAPAARRFNERHGLSVVAGQEAGRLALGLQIER